MNSTWSSPKFIHTLGFLVDCHCKDLNKTCEVWRSHGRLQGLHVVTPLPVLNVPYAGKGVQFASNIQRGGHKITLACKLPIPACIASFNVLGTQPSTPNRLTGNLPNTHTERKNEKRTIAKLILRSRAIYIKLKPLQILGRPALLPALPFSYGKYAAGSFNLRRTSPHLCVPSKQPLYQ